MHRIMVRKAAVATAQSPHGQRREIFQYAASHPVEVVLGASLAAAIVRVFELELKTRTQNQKLKMNKAQHQSFEKSEKELRFANQELQRQFDVLRDETNRMKASIIDRGKAGEKILGNLLHEMKTQDVIKDYKLQHPISPVKRPDAVVYVMGEDTCIVIDSKAPSPPTNIDDHARRKDYVDTLKQHVAALTEKRYSVDMKQQIPMVTLMLLPGEGYLQAAYNEEGEDVFALHKFARDKNVIVLGPNGLRTYLQVVKIWLEEQAQKDRLDVVDITTTLQPLWVQNLLPEMKKTSNLLEKVVTNWNSKVDNIIEFDKTIRSKAILDIAKARKSQLPKKVTLPKTINGEVVRS